MSGSPVICNDFKSCTNDKCVSGKCTFTNVNTNKCTDNNACTVGDYCSSGKCIAGKPKVCTDSTKCTTNYCNGKTGACATTAAYNNYVCELGSDSRCDNKVCKCRVWQVNTSNSGATALLGTAPAADGGLISVGRETVSEKGYEGLIVRHDKYGKLKWKVYVPASTKNDELVSVTRLKDSAVHRRRVPLHRQRIKSSWVVR